MRAKPAVLPGAVKRGARASSFRSAKKPDFALKTVLVPVDFSESSRKALRYALSFARQFKAKLLLLHVVEPLPAPPEVVYLESSSIYADARKTAEKQLSVWRQAAAAEVRVSGEIRVGVAYREIVDAAKEFKVDLIVVGTHGRTGLAHLFMGNTAERVVREAGCPGLVVRQSERDFVGNSRSRRSASGPYQHGRVRSARRRVG